MTSDLHIIDGAEHGMAGSGVQGAFDNHTGVITNEAGAGRNGGRCYKFDGLTTSGEYHYSGGIRVASFQGYFKMGADARPTGTLARWTNANGNLEVRFNSASGKAQVFAATGSLTQDFGPVLADDIWYQLLVSVNTTANPGVIIARVIADGGTWDGTSGTVSPSQAAADLTKTWIAYSGSASGKIARWDDVTQSHATSGTPAKPYPMDPYYVVGLFPTGDGSHNAGTANDLEYSGTGVDITNASTDVYTLLDDVGMDTSGTDYVRDIGATQTTYVEITFADTPAQTTPIDVRALSTFSEEVWFGSSNGGFTQVVLGDGTDVTPAVKQHPGNTGQTIQVVRRVLDKPTGGWTKAKVDGLRARLGFSNANGTRYQAFALEVVLAAGGEPDPPGAFAVGKAQVAQVGITIDGRDVTMSQWRCDVEADWGDRTLTGRITRDVTWAEQGAPVVVWRRADEALWSGELVADPRIDGGAMWIRGEGNAAKLDDDRTRMFYRIDGCSQYVDGDSDPHNLASSEKIDMFLGPGAIRWHWGNNADALSSGDATSAVIWVEDSEITRYSFIANATPVSNTTADIRVWRATGPSGTLNTVGTHTLNIASPTTYASDVATPEDMLVFGLRINTNVTPNGRRRGQIRGLKVYGRTTDDAFSASDVVADLAALVGIPTDAVQESSVKILPLDWSESHTDLADYMSELTDWRWMVRHDGMHFGPYETTWEASTARETSGEIEPERRYNRVVQPFRVASGALRTAEATPITDPLPGQDVVWFNDILEDTQPDDTVASAVAQAQADYLASHRITANLRVVRAKHDGWPRSPLEIDAGDLINLTDLSPDLPPQRISAATYEMSPGQVEPRVGIEVGWGFNPIKTLVEAERNRPRRRRHRRGRRLQGGPRG